LEKGVRNFISFPQQIISTRTFESEYLITTEVEMHGEYDALRIASERFSDVATTLSLVAKNKVINTANKKRIKRGDETYDFEILGIFIKKGKRLIRLKLPPPLISSRNFFPKPFPKNFLGRAKKYLQLQDSVFQKGLIYFQRATAMKHSGTFNHLEIVLNFVKCIELISSQVATVKKKQKDLGMKKLIEVSGKEIGVVLKAIKGAKESWDARNKGDIAHEDLYFNPYSRRSSNAIINIDILESNTSEFLRKYHKYKANNSLLYRVF